jgi:hypothetical protein
MSKFTEGMSLSTQPAMDQMGQTLWYRGSIPLKGIFDPVGRSTSQITGGRSSDVEFTLYLTRVDISTHGIKKGDKFSVSHGSDTVKVRVHKVNDDGTDLLSLECGPTTQATIPRI